MAGNVYPLAKQALELAQINLITSTVKIALLTAAYTYNPLHQFRSSLVGVVALSDALSSKTNDSGVFRAANILLPAVVGGSIVTQIAGYIDTGSIATDPLLWLSTGYSVLTNGADVTVVWDTGPFGIFAI